MAAAVVRLESVSKCFWRGKRPVDVLVDASLELFAGEVGAVCGPPRSGKTTLLSLAAGLLEPDAGQVLFGDRDLATVSRAERAALLHGEIGVANREGPPHRDIAVADWIATSLSDRVGRRAALLRAHRVLARVGVANVAGEPWNNLSDHERTLTAIARGVVRQPKLLLVDEPSAGLGLLKRAEVMDLLRSLADDAGLAVLISAADMSEVQGARPIWSLADGLLAGGFRSPAASVIDFPTQDRTRSSRAT